MCLSLPPDLHTPLGYQDYFGIALWLIGFSFEAIADYQKFRWQLKLGDERKKKFMNSGVFKYCRYPNYFGEITLWFGSYFIASAAFPHSWVAKYGLAASPLFTTFILTRLSGIPLSEKMAKERFAGNEAYAEYRKNTNLLIPWFPKKTSKTS